MLGYILSQEEILNYYGQERTSIAEAIFRYGHDRDTVLVLDTGLLARGEGDGPGFNQPHQIVEIARESLNQLGGRIPRKYPAFHGTVCKYINSGISPSSRKVIGTDMVFDVDVKTNYREAFSQGARIVAFLDRYDVPYRVKFSGNTSPHIILPCEAFPQPFPANDFKRLFKTVQEKSGAEHLDSSFSSPSSHFLRMPYSLNERTGLVSLPLMRDEFDTFEPSLAEWQNVGEVKHDWFRLPEDAGERMGRFLVDVLAFSARDVLPRQPEAVDNW